MIIIAFRILSSDHWNVVLTSTCRVTDQLLYQQDSSQRSSSISIEIVASKLVVLAKYVGNDMSHQMLLCGNYHAVTFDNTVGVIDSHNNFIIHLSN